MTTPNRPPSCDKLNPNLKECFNCGSIKVELIQCEGGFAGCDICFSQGPENDPHGHKWNSIPRRSEVAELLRLVDELKEVKNMTSFDYVLAVLKDDFYALHSYADKLRKEWKL